MKMNEDFCKYCHNFYSTYCSRCRKVTGVGTDPDFYCTGEEKKVQKNWIDYQKAIKKLQKLGCY